MATEKNITEENRSLGALLRLPYIKLQALTYSELAGSGFGDIRPAHSAVFRHILPGGSRVTELADRAQVTKQSMAYLVNYLHEKGYVELLPDPADGRAKIVKLTARGNAFQQDALRLSKLLEERLAVKIGSQRMAQLRGLLEKVTGDIDDLELKNGAS